MVPVGLLFAPVLEQAVRPAIEHAVDPLPFRCAQPAAVVVARGVEPRVQPGFDAPVVDVRLKPLRQRELSRTAVELREALHMQVSVYNTDTIDIDHGCHTHD